MSRESRMLSDLAFKFIRYTGLFFALLFHFHFALAQGDNIQISRQQYNVILICVDTLRADHLGCYGYFRNTSPNIDKLAGEGILFEQAISQSTRTLSSHASIFTSEYVPVHGVYFFNRLPDSEVTLAGILRNNGYKTVAFTGKGNCRAIFGFNNGFDIFDDGESLKEWSRSFKDTVPPAVKWLKANKDKKFFLFLHGYDVHSPYYSKSRHAFGLSYKGITSDENTLSSLNSTMYKHFLLRENGELIKLKPEDINYIVSHYDEGIRYADKNIGDFLQEIRKLGILDNTIVVLFADHGEELLERGHMSRHGSNYYDEVIHVPLIIRYPDELKARGIRIKTQAQLIDIMPTVLDSLGIPKNREAQGDSLLLLVEGKAPPNFNEYVYSECNVIRASEWKAIDCDRLYNLKQDPQELTDLAEQNPGILLKFNQKFKEWKQKCALIAVRRLRYKKNDFEVIKKDIENLKDAGYW